MSVSTLSFAALIIYMFVSFMAVGVKFRLQNTVYFRLPFAAQLIISVVHAAIVLSNVVLYCALAIASRDELTLAAPVRIGGAVAGLAGIYFIISSGARLKWELFRPSQTRPFVKTGNYRVVRHPMYMGGILGAFGISLAAASWRCLLYSGVFSLVLFIVAWLEEKDLAERFGDEFEQMRRGVPMLFPSPGPVMRLLRGWKHR